METPFVTALRDYHSTAEIFDQPTTISLAETSLMTPSSPQSISSDPSKEEKKPTKKRKSWGQELPIPKTQLPPRKRAKTEDEKEQRRIERVLRNRQAAQSSRERKRLEVEKLEGEKHEIERQNADLKRRLMRVEHEKFQLAQRLAKSLSEQGVNDDEINSATTFAAPPSPTPTTESFPHQHSIKREPEDHFESLPSPRSTPQSFDLQSTFSSVSPSSSRASSPTQQDFDGSATSSDMTQHPAEMLCGLQCLSEAATWHPSLSTGTPKGAKATTTPHLSSSLSPPALPSLSATNLLSLSLLWTTFSTLLLPLSSLLTSLRTASVPSTTAAPSFSMTPMHFLLIQWLISTPRLSLDPAVLPPASPTTTSPLPPTTSSTDLRTSRLLRTIPSTFRLSLLRRLLASSPSMARPLRDATGRALQMKTSYALRGLSSDDGAEGASAKNEKMSAVDMASLDRWGVRDNDGLGGWESLTNLAAALKTLEEEEQNATEKVNRLVEVHGVFDVLDHR
ncbi:hypothetical protein MMC25_002442 [Agyrium rufum]|nr:hypothetical protein [Agyrium rufum]